MLTSEHWNSVEGHPQHELSDDNEQCLHRLFEAVYSEGDLSVVEELVAPTFSGDCAGIDVPVQGASGVKAHATRLRSTFVNLDIEIVDLQPTPDGFRARLVATGRFERPFGRIRPTCLIGSARVEPHGPHVRFTGIASGTFCDGRLKQWDLDWDFEALRAQNELAGAGHS